MISHIRPNILGYIMRTVHSGIAAGVVTPEGPGAASASLALMHARQNSVYWISSASMPCTCRCWSILVGRLRDGKGEPHHELGFRPILGRELVHDLRHDAGAVIEPIAQRRHRDEQRRAPTAPARRR